MVIAVVIITVIKTITATNDRSIRHKTDSSPSSAPNRSYSSAEASAEETQEKVEDYSDFSNPTNLLRAPTWITAAQEVRPFLVDRAMNAFLKELDQKRDKRVGGHPVWTPAGKLTSKGEAFVAKTRQFLLRASQDPDGGIYHDEYSRRWELVYWVNEFWSE